MGGTKGNRTIYIKFMGIDANLISFVAAERKVPATR
jgi:hypothetical protein